MLISTEVLSKVKKVDSELQSSISSSTGLSKEDIRLKNIEDIEKHVGIQPKKHEFFFMWEKGEKDGWQTSLKFINEREFEKREKEMEKELKNK
jgi:hypothetical protein